jgi:2,5-furandicarboxylate decarboxylase 1
MSMGCETYPEIEFRLERGIEKPIPPRYVESCAAKQVIMTGKDVDLFSLPIPMFSIYDGGPMITAGITIARDPEFGLNSGIYRFMVKEKNLTGIDIVTPNNMRMYAQRAYEAGRVCPISISIGTHPVEIMGANFRAPIGVDEMGITGGIRGVPVELAQCETIDMPCIADAEIVLEGEILPVGWTHPEGRFGEFTRLMGGLHWNPLVRIKAITMRRDPIYYALHMPWENTWLAAPSRYSAIRAALKNAGVQVKDINVTLGGCAFWHAVISIRKQAGEGKNALIAALSVLYLKHVVVVDEDVDPTDLFDVMWAMCTRCDPVEDIEFIRKAWSGPLDPRIPKGTSTNSRAVIDACRPFEMLKDFPPVACASPELKQRVAEKFKSFLVGL